MSVTATLQVKVILGDQVIDCQQTLTGEAAELIDVSIPDEAVDTQVAFAHDRSEGAALLIVADGVCTLKTNNSGAPDDTLVLAADKPICWQSGNTKDAAALPLFDADVTALYVSNASGAAVRLRIFSLGGVTP